MTKSASELLPAEFRRELHWMRESVRDKLNSLEFHDLSASQRGVLGTLNIYSWWEGPLPSAVDRLARLVRLQKAELAKALPALASAGFYVPTPANDAIYSPKLEKEV